MSNYPFKEIHVEMPDHDADVIITFPGGKQLTIQARPSNADRLSDGKIYNGSLDVILPENQFVTTWKGDDMEPSEPSEQEECRLTKQMVMELPR